jgi:uncharacterized protein
MTLRRRLMFLTAAVLGLIAGCLALEDKIVFQPTTGRVEPVPPEPPVRDLTLRLDDGTPIHARWCPRSGSPVAVIYCHGNGGDLEIRARPIRDLGKALGESVLIFDYPGYGRSGGKPSESGCYAAADVVYAWLTQEQRVRPENVVIFGESLGGGVAIDLASRRPHRALVVLKTFTSIPDVAEEHIPFLPIRGLVTNNFSNEEKINRCKGPILIAQADSDQMVPFGHGLRLLSAAGPKALFVPLKASGHNDPLPPSFYAILKDFLDHSAPEATEPTSDSADHPCSPPSGRVATFDEIAALNELANDRTAPPRQRVEAVLALFVKYVRVGNGANELRRVLRDTAWLDDAKLEHINPQIMEGWIPIGLTSADRTYCVRFFPENREVRQADLWFRLSGRTAAGKEVERGLQFLRGVEEPDCATRIMDFSLSYPSGRLRVFREDGTFGECDRY